MRGEAIVVKSPLWWLQVGLQDIGKTCYMHYPFEYCNDTSVCDVKLMCNNDSITLLQLCMHKIGTSSK